MCRMSSKLEKEGNCSCKSWRRFRTKISKMLGFIKKKVRKFHTQNILRKDFKVSQKVLLHHSYLKIFQGNIHSRWIGPFLATNVFPYGVVEIQNLSTNKRYSVYGGIQQNEQGSLAWPCIQCVVINEREKLLHKS
ncbi:uncharacterized protein LOC127259651 isoform X1 [Andrographis paniculata]|uniref:uncharacterized protein LOC127259651 isoform X1 n=1 Tax=Andrographis paniculata TaxID=175694 RepID=UPI0021E97086|nr:uncharacterized protein LOC127259651 isoform X1 [Andrographis paniculata]